MEDHESSYRANFNFMSIELYESIQAISMIAPFNARKAIWVHGSYGNKLRSDITVIFANTYDASYTMAELNQIFHN